MQEADPVSAETERAAAEAGAIGGATSSEPPAGGEPIDEAQRPLIEAGQGEAEGFEQAEQELHGAPREKSEYRQAHAGFTAMRD